MDTIDANIHLGFDADERDYGVGAQILRSLGVSKMRLMTNNPIKRVGLEGFNLEVVSTVTIEIEPNEYNQAYLKTKRDRMGHFLRSLNTNQEWEFSIVCSIKAQTIRQLKASTTK